MNDTNTRLELDIERGLVDSLYGESRPLLIGVVNCTFAFALCYLSTFDNAFIWFGVAFWLTGIGRFILHRRYTTARNKLMGYARLQYWKSRCILGGTTAAFVLGGWCYYSLTGTNDSFAQLTSVTVTIACTVGIAARNFGCPRYVTYQMLAVATPLVLGLVLHGNYLKWGLGALYGTYFLAIIGIAKSLKSVLHTAIRREAQVSSIAQDLRTALQATPNGLMMFDEHDKLKICCDDAAAMLGLPGEIQKSRCSALEIFKHMRKNLVLNDELSTSVERDYLSIKNRPGSQLKNFVLNNAKGQTLKFLMQTDESANLIVRIDDVTQEHASNAKIKTLARTDALTGLVNRAWFLEQAEASKQNLDTKSTILIAAIDLDGFKSINDTYGHPLGDRLLQHVAKCLRSVSRAEDLVARFGGDEFMMLMILERGNEVQLQNIAERLQSSINGLFLDGDLKIEMGGSVGVAVQQASPETIEDLILKADTALYEAKRGGKRRVCVHSLEMEEKQLRQTALTTGLKQAIAKDRLTTVYQPIVDGKTGTVHDYEALCRWHHPEFGFVGPNEFIPIAEENGLVSNITRLQLLSACQACSTLPAEVGVSVNLSAIDLRSDRILEHIDTALDGSGLAAERLTVEVTETSLLDLKTDTINLLNEIRSRGIKVALDDFGVGYSSLNYLHKLPIDRLKIDRSFVAQIEQSSKALTLLAIIGQLASALKLQIVIEGVETEDQLALITRNIKAPLIQGYLFSKPLPENEIISYCTNAQTKVQAKRLTA